MRGMILFMPLRTVLIDPHLPAAPTGQLLVLYNRPPWTFSMLSGVLGIMHLAIWTISILHQHYEAYLSLFFGCAFSAIAVALLLTRYELEVVNTGKFIKLSTRVGRFHSTRHVPFSEVTSIRLTMTDDGTQGRQLIEIVCRDEVIECPPTCVAQQEALCLAMLMDVRLIKATDDVTSRNISKSDQDYSSRDQH